MAMAGIGGLLFVNSSVLAGGYDTGQRDWDLLFQQKNIAFEASTININPERQLHNITGALGPSADAFEAEAFSVQRFGLAMRLGEGFRCLASIQEPWAGHANYGAGWTYAFSAIEQHFSSEDLGLTCAASIDAGKGKLSVVAGASHQEIEYVLTQSRGGPLIATTNVSDSGIGWRAGLAYEIPEYALRASVIYNSAIDYQMTGTLVDPVGYTGPIYGSIEMPQSAEFKFQSGIAPGWLAFGSLKWVDWSAAANMPLCPTIVPICTQAGAASGLTLLWEDTWTVSLGVAHQFSQQFSLAANVTWDQGGTRGFTSRTDTLAGGLTAVLVPSENLEFRLTGTAGRMKGGSLSTMTLADGTPNPLGYTATFGADWVYAMGISAIFNF